MRPELIVVLGTRAARHFFGNVRLKDLRGPVIRRDDRRYIVTYPPGYRFKKDLEQVLAEDLARVRAELEGDR